MSIIAKILTDSVREPEYAPNGCIRAWVSSTCMIDNTFAGAGWGEFIHVNGSNVVRESNVNIYIPDSDMSINLFTENVSGISHIAIRMGKIHVQYKGNYYLHLNRDFVQVSEWHDGYNGGYHIVAEIPF